MENNPEFVKIIDDLKKLFCKDCKVHRKPMQFLGVRSEMEIKQTLKDEGLSKSAKTALEWVLFIVDNPKEKRND